MGGAGADAGAEGGHRGPDRDGAASPTRNARPAHTRFIVSDDPDEVVEKIGVYLDLGFDDLLLHAPGPDQPRFLDQFGADVLPRLRERFG